MQHTKKKRRLTEAQGKLAADHIGMVDRYISYLLGKRRIEYREIDDLRGYLEQRLCITTTFYDADKGSFPAYARGAFRYALLEYYKKQNNRKRLVLSDMRAHAPEGEFQMEEPEAPEKIRFDVSFLLKFLCGDEKKVIGEYLEGFTTGEIGEKLNYSTRWIRILYYSAVDKLKTITTWRLLEFGDFRSG